MKKSGWVYIQLLILAAFSFTALFLHFAKAFDSSVKITAGVPFNYSNGAVASVTDDGEKAGIKVGDVLEKFNGRKIESFHDYFEEMPKIKTGDNVLLELSRKTADGGQKTYRTNVTAVELKKNFNLTDAITGILFVYVLPTFCILLGFWVAFVRPRDFSAWILLFVLLGLSSISLENYSPKTFVGTFQDIFFSTWALAMLLFGIYFPERWSVDRKFPWLKWILIIPLGVQIILTIFNLIQIHLGFDLNSYFDFLRVFTQRDIILTLANTVAIGMFFFALGHKAWSLQNPDSRRRLKLMLFGTMAAMTPSFIMVLYRIFSGKRGDIFTIFPAWAAVTALLMLLLFPLTMAYVIVVHRAMDVRVVIRQGLQYALAKNGVKILQFVILAAIMTGIFLAIRNEESTATQIGFIVGGLALLPLIDYVAKKMRVWIDRRFFREAYNAELILSDLSEEVRTMVETKPLLETVSTKISESLHVPQIALLLRNGNNFQSAHALGYEDFPSVELAENDKTVEKLKKNEPLTIYEDDRDSWINEELETSEREKLQKLNSQLLLPIGAKNGLSGVISLSPKRSEEPYSPNDLRLLKSVAAQTGLALENSRLTEAIAFEAAQKERLNTEIEIAREVQERLFPQELPKIEGLDYYGACRPALGVGGDYYDFLELPDNKFGIAIGDVSGKGIGASLMMASLQASLRGQAIHNQNDLAELMKHVNTLVYEASTSNRYATFFYAQLDVKTKHLIYVNAGHNPPVLLRANGEMLKLEEGGAVVGMLPSMFANYTQGEIQLEPGDLLVGSTDGITEAMNPNEEEWTEDAMLEELKKVIEKTSEEILHYIVTKADEFAAGAKQHDDMTMIVVKVL